MKKLRIVQIAYRVIYVIVEKLQLCQEVRG